MRGTAGALFALPGLEVVCLRKHGVDSASSCLLTGLMLLLCFRPRFLILIVVIVSVGAVIGNVYIIAFYQHPEARARKAKSGACPPCAHTPSPQHAT